MCPGTSNQIGDDGECCFGSVFGGCLVRDLVSSVQARGGYNCMRADSREGGIRGVRSGREVDSDFEFYNFHRHR